MKCEHTQNFAKVAPQKFRNVKNHGLKAIYRAVKHLNLKPGVPYYAKIIFLAHIDYSFFKQRLANVRKGLPMATETDL